MQAALGGFPMDTDILIIGGGLAGLALADRLKAQSRDWLLVEAQSRLGGRILSPEIAGARFDLGPAWFWPGQARLAALAQKLRLPVFEQYGKGATLIQDRDGLVQAHHGSSPMQGSLRIAGGMAALIDGLAQALPAHRIRPDCPVTALHRSGTRITAPHAQGAVTARRVVLALPPRIAAQTIAFTPALPDPAQTAARAIPTWMAGQAKILAVYADAPWRKAGLSGTAMSRKGPLVEIHDASPMEGGPSALFGFVGLPPALRASHADEVTALALAQLQALFGPAMAQPLSIRMMDWARLPQIATALDLAPPPGHHPSYGLPAALRGLWDNALIFGATETATAFGGYLEGALEAADRVADQLTGPPAARSGP